MLTTRSAGRSHARIACALSIALVLPAASCGQPDAGGVVETADEPLGMSLSALCMAQSRIDTPSGLASALAPNGMSTNGLSGNGLCQNGLAASGLNRARLNDADFAAWFNQDPALASMIMKYLYRCAAPPWKSITWRNPSTGVIYRWTGGLGLAPDWVSGAAATTAEQQVVSACLGALTNKYGVSVQIAIEGRSATGVPIPVDPGELTTYPVREGCFFGNVFAGQGLFVGMDHWPWDSSTSSPRACALDTRLDGASTQCPPINQVGYCRDLCVLDATGTFYETCTLNGVTYRPLTTRMSPWDIYRCGDGVCEFTESCGNGWQYDNCQPDCGPCP